MSFKEYLKIQTTSAIDLNSKMPFLRNEFSIIFKNFYDDLIYGDGLNLCLNEIVDRKMFTRNYSNWTNEFLPTAWGLKKVWISKPIVNSWLSFFTHLYKKKLSCKKLFFILACFRLYTRSYWFVRGFFGFLWEKKSVDIRISCYFYIQIYKLYIFELTTENLFDHIFRSLKFFSRRVCIKIMIIFSRSNSFYRESHQFLLV